jgi:hypothetical protein
MGGIQFDVQNVLSLNDIDIENTNFEDVVQIKSFWQMYCYIYGFKELIKYISVKFSIISIAKNL